jgi:aspartate kinase
VYTADPRQVSAAQLLEAISHEEMVELATHGAKVLHAECVDFARRSGVALYARATASEAPGTRIDAAGAGGQRSAGVSGQKSLVRVRTEDAGQVMQVMAALAGASVPLVYTAHRGDALEVWFGLDDIPDWTRVRAALSAAAGASAVTESLGAVSCVGLGLGADAATLSRVRAVAVEAGAELLALEASPLRITVFCHSADVDGLVAALHRALCE